jgi:predicted lipoprotein
MSRSRRIPLRLHRWLACALASMALAACAGSGSGKSQRREALDSLTANVFLPMLADFEQASAELSREADAFCADPDDAGRARVREAWDAARASWEQAEVLSFGPQTLSPWRLSSQLDFWPARPDSVEELLAGDMDLSSPDALEHVGAATKGLPVLEYVLYGDGTSADALGGATPEERRCQYLRALGVDLHARASDLLEVWETEFAADLTLEEGPGRYESVNQAFGEVVNNLAFTVEVARDEKLGRPLGSSAREPKPEAVASRFSDRSIDDLRDNLRGIEAVFTGAYGEQRGPGVSALLGDREQVEQAVFDTHLQLAYDALDGIQLPLREAVVDERSHVTAAMDALRELLIYLQVDLTQSLTVTVTFGGADGD